MSAARSLVVDAGPGSLQGEGGWWEEAGAAGAESRRFASGFNSYTPRCRSRPGLLWLSAARARQVRGLSAKEEDTTPTNREQGPIY